MNSALRASLITVLVVAVLWFAYLLNKGDAASHFVHQAARGSCIVEGQVELDEDVPLGVVRVHFRTIEGVQAERNVAVGDDGYFHFSGPAGGRAMLEVFAPGRSDPIRVAGPLRLQSPVDPIHFDLKGQLVVSVVEVLDPEGLPAEAAQVAWRPSGAEVFRDFGLATNGVYTLATAVDPVDLYVQSKGARSQLVRNVVGETRVELRPRISVVLQLPEGINPQADGVQLLGSVIRNKAPKALEGSLPAIIHYLRVVDRINLGSRTSGAIELPSGGSYRVEWRLFDSGNDRFLSFPGSPAPSTFEIRANQQGSVVVPFFPEELYSASIQAR